jgi:hypothetical protein
MYIGKASISNLFMFLEGYETARDELGIEPTEAEMDFYENFHDFLEKRYKLHTSNSWANIILFHCGDEKQALERFFKLLDEFRSKDRTQPLTEDKDLPKPDPQQRVFVTSRAPLPGERLATESDREAYR